MQKEFAEKQDLSYPLIAAPKSTAILAKIGALSNNKVVR